MLLLKKPNPKEILDVVYTELDYKSGALHNASVSPNSYPDTSLWIDKGEWLTAAKRAGAEKVFFVDNNPVVIFAQCEADDTEKIKVFNRIWCLARPRLFFLASPGELTVLDLAQKPVDEKTSKNWGKLKKLAILDDVSKVLSELQQFHRDNVESGRVFGDQRFGDLDNRADKALIRDLKTIRLELVKAGLSDKKIRYAHALIGRSIFIRYLEDRGILDEKYFRNVAMREAGWTDLLKSPPQGCFDSPENPAFYPSVLANKNFTYTLFKTLARDFNGDMFPDVEAEERIVKQKHLNLIRELLYGNTGIQKKLFFYSYRFDIVPLELISSIYEEFYHTPTQNKDKKSKARQNGAYYTPPVLAEFVLSRVLTHDSLKKNPRVLDMACGSGIFLVEAFRRIVRYKWHKKKAPLTFDELKNILKNQIAGIEAIEEAARIAAFSLYLSMLHYLDPPAIVQHIKQGNKLPNLLASNSKSSNHYHCILHANTFDVDFIESNSLWNFGKNCADVIVGNPPWGAPGKKADEDTKERHQKMLDWCRANSKPIGDQEPSQAFLWRTLDFLRNKGKVGMLVPAGVFFKHGATTQAFRKQWLDNINVNDVFNFTHVRKLFFKGADSPFLAVCFSSQNHDRHPTLYWCAKQILNFQKIQAVSFSMHDMNIFHNKDLSRTDTWKVFWFGSVLDEQAINYLDTQTHLLEVISREVSGQGFKLASKEKEADDLKKYPCLDIDSFSRYDPLHFSDPPRGVHRFGVIDVYSGHRLLVQRGILEKGKDKGKIVARYETEPFCFTNAINGIKLSSPEEWKYKVLLGILWSSVARYYFFMTSSNWGLWHHEIHLDDELLQLPVVLDKTNPATEEVISIVDKLRNYHPQMRDVLHPKGTPESVIITKRRNIESQLDEAVFKLYGLNEEQKDLIHDCCDVTLPFFYQPFKSVGAMPAVDKADLSWIEIYIHIFCKRWNTYLGEKAEMRAEIHIGAHDNIIAIEFYAADANDPWNLIAKNEEWGEVLEKIGRSLPQSMGTSQVVLDGLVHIVSDDGIIIIKRNEKRFWTRSLAREDADATICKRMTNTLPQEGDIVNGTSFSS